MVDVTELFRENYPFEVVCNEMFGEPCFQKHKCLYFMSSEDQVLGTMREDSNQFIPYRKLVMGAIFKNETWILKEWLDHYIKEGVEHFFLINNNSTDDYLSVLKPYCEEGLVTLFHEPRNYVQVDSYNDYFMPLRHSAEWIIVCDLDEFIYSRKGYRRIVDYLNSVDKNVSAVSIPWKMFGSSHLIDHPKDGVLKNFIHRKLYDGNGEFPMNNRNNKSINCKTICRFDMVYCLGMHNPILLEGYGITSDEEKIEMDSHQQIDETILENSALHINHYAVQSLEFFRKIKQVRTDAFAHSANSARTDDYFDRYDWNDICDVELKNKKYL
jgi:hypothetical protein